MARSQTANSMLTDRVEGELVGIGRVSMDHGTSPIERVVGVGIAQLPIRTVQGVQAGTNRHRAFL